jgi:predicted metalloprotease with PDZ domain
MARYGYGSPSAYIESIANTVQQERSRPGNRKQSLTDCSFDAWIKYWRQNQNAYNAEADYYEKGSQVSMLLDLEIRNRSANAASLEDVLRELYRTRDHGYTVEDVQRIAERLCRSSLQEFFANYVEGTSPLPWEANLKYAGLALAPRDTLRRSWTGLNTYDSGDRTIVARVLDASPALDAGLEVNDELLAVNGYRARSADLAARVEESKPGQSIQVTVFRDGWLKEFDVSVGTQPVPAYTLVRVQSPTELQKAIYRSWLGEAWQ